MSDQQEKQPHRKVSEFVRRLRLRIETDPTLNAARLAKDSGLDQSAIRQLLSGRAKTPKLETVLQIMDALGTTYEEFMGQPTTPEEREILRLLERLPVHERRQLVGFAKFLTGEPNSPLHGESAGN